MSLEEEVINYLKENPGASIREIAEALGLNYSIIRTIVYKLRSSGIISKSERGFYILRDRSKYMGLKGATKVNTDTLIDSVEQLRSSVNEIIKRLESLELKYESISKDLSTYTSLKELVTQLKETIDRMNTKITLLEKEITNLKKQIEIIGKYTSTLRRTIPSKDRDVKSSIRILLKSQGIIEVEEAKRIADSHTIHELIEQGAILVIGPYIVSKEYYNQFKRKFPIPLSEEGKLSSLERKLLKVMLSEGLAYIHGGREYRIIE